MKISILLAGTLLGCRLASATVTFYVPPEGAQEGNSSLGPFSDSSRLQQVYAHEAFPIIGSDSAFSIRMLTFRFDRFGTVNAPSLSVEVHLSTTSRNPDGLSTVFSENIGPDETTVFGPSSPSLHPIYVGIPLERPFFYNPAAGNLLLDIRTHNPATFPDLDAYAVLGDSVSTVSTGLGADRPTGGLATHGLVTLFTVDIVPIPEPSATALLLLGMAALGWKFRSFLKSSSTHR
jgi:hypothetical protein